jgi:catalase (peroxidase I)
MAQYQMIQQAVRAIEPPPTDFQGQQDFFGGLVRLPFHDAGTYTKSSNLYGPQGCLNFSDPGNGGLPPIIDMLEPIYIQYKEFVSRADFWVIAAHTAIKDAGGPTIPFQSGRKDCGPDFYKPTGLLPNPEMGWSNIMDVFVTRMGLSQQDIVALIGAHTLGRCQLQNSGYQFPWDATSQTFDNRFYVDLLNAPWIRMVNNETGTHQWDINPYPGGNFMMLNTDMSLRFANAGDDTCQAFNQSTCQSNTATIGLIQTYAQNQTRWFQDFTVGWNKLTSLGYSNLKPLA